MSINVNKQGVKALEAMFQQLDVELNTNRHLTSATHAAGAILFEQFMIETHAQAAIRPEQFHHVYEWNHIGEFGWQLFKPVMRGTGGNRTISFEWRASKTTVPVETDALGRKKWPDWFDTSKLRQIHVFVWKAPVMEYGIDVEVRPKLSGVLVMPNPNRVLDLDVDPRAPRTVVFTPHPYVIHNPGGPAQGKFTSWFAAWFDGRAPIILREMFNQKVENAYKRAFNARLRNLPGGTNTLKQARIGIDAAAAAKGRNIAALIAGELEKNYIAMAAERKRVVDGY